MDVKIFEINKTGVKILTKTDFNRKELDNNSVYLYAVQCDSRAELSSDLSMFELHEDILQGILEPSENIRFNFFDETAYGEIAFFSDDSPEPIEYMGIINKKNTLIIIGLEDGDDKILEEAFDSYSKILLEKDSIPETKHLLYFILVESITCQSNLLLRYREKIETIGKQFAKKKIEVETNDFLYAKSRLADFGQVLEKLHFSLYFPPVRTILNQNSSFRLYFEELLKTVEMQKISLNQAEKRLQSLHEHFLLLLQEKSNKRINFLTIIQAIFVPLTLLTGIYGMNFINMPELNHKYGYFFVLGALVVIASIFLRYFKKHGWFD